MGASESTAKSNGTKEEEEEERQQPSAGTLVAAAVAGVAVAGVAAWGVSRMLSDDTDGQQKQEAMKFRPEPSYSNSSNRIRLQGTFKMETSGACHPEQGPDVKKGPSGYGGILRDDRGKWVRGFLGFLPNSDAFKAEFHGMLIGLQLLDKLGLVGSILESDHESAAEYWINKPVLSTRDSKVVDEDCWEIILNCRSLKQKNDIKVVYRSNEHNSAKNLATIAIYERQSYAEIKNLNHDNNNTTTPDPVRVKYRGGKIMTFQDEIN